MSDTTEAADTADIADAAADTKVAADHPNQDIIVHNNQKEDEVSIVRCDTSAGPFVMKFIRSWSPLGYDRATALFRLGYYDNSHIYRVVPDFLVQFGIGYTQSDKLWKLANAEKLQDDPKLDPPIPFEEGTIAFAGSGNNTRTSELFISYSKQTHKFGKNPWETPIGKVIDGMDVLKNLYSGYGDVKPIGDGPDQTKIGRIGRSYIEENFPLLDHFKMCTVEKESDNKKPHTPARDEVVGGRATAEIRKLAASMTLKESAYDTVLDGYEQKVPLSAGTKRHRISAYRDHHDNVQATEGTGWSILFAFMLMASLVWASFAISRGFSKKSGRRSKAL